MIDFVIVDRPGEAIPAPCPTIKQAKHLETVIKNGLHGGIRRTTWSVMPALLSRIMVELYPSFKSPRSLPDNVWTASVAVYEAWHLMVFGLEHYERSQLKGSTLFWGGDYSTLLLVQLTLVKEMHGGGRS